MPKLFLLFAVVSLTLADVTWASIERANAKRSGTVFKIGINDAYAHSPGKQAVQQLFDQLYAPLNIQPHMQYFPSKRSLKETNQGLLDADAGRIARVGDQFQQLVKVPEPFFIIELGLFCVEKDACRLNNQSVVASVKGFEAAKSYCREQAWSCLHDKNNTFLASAINAGSVDALFAGLPSPIAAKVLCMLESDRFFFRPITALRSITYHYVHKRHSELVIPLSNSINALHKNGAIKQFFDAIGSPKQLCGKELVTLSI